MHATLPSSLEARHVFSQFLPSRSSPASRQVLPTAAHSYCGDGPAAITSVEVGPFDQYGTFTVMIGYQNAAELSWWWNNGGQNNALLSRRHP